MSFYMTLPSNSSMMYYPDNTLANYVTKLPQVIELSGEWEVGLAEIQFSKNWFNVHESDRRMSLGVLEDNVLTMYDISPPCGYYAHPQMLVDSINDEIYWIEANHKLPRFSYHALTKKVSVKFGSLTDDEPQVILTMTTSMAEILGFEWGVDPPQVIMIQHSHSKFSMFASDQLRVHGTVTKLQLNTEGMVELTSGTDRYIASKVCDMRRGFHSMFVYCDIVEHEIVGDHKVPLLRTVNVNGDEGEMIDRIYQTVQYVPLQRRQFDTIEIAIKDDTGAAVPFQSGRVIVTLHFRMRKTFYV